MLSPGRPPAAVGGWPAELECEGELFHQRRPQVTLNVSTSWLTPTSHPGTLCVRYSAVSFVEGLLSPEPPQGPPCVWLWWLSVAWLPFMSHHSRDPTISCFSCLHLLLLLWFCLFLLLFWTFQSSLPVFPKESRVGGRKEAISLSFCFHVRALPFSQQLPVTTYQDFYREPSYSKYLPKKIL